MRRKTLTGVLLMVGLIGATGCRGDDEADVQEFETTPAANEVVDTIAAPAVPPAPE